MNLEERLQALGELFLHLNSDTEQEYVECLLDLRATEFSEEENEKVQTALRSQMVRLSGNHYGRLPGISSLRDELRETLVDLVKRLNPVAPAES